MANFVLAYKGGEPPTTEEQGAAVMAAWGAWFGTVGAAIVDGGTPFGSSAAVAPDGSVSEGGPSGLTGYTIVSADSLGAAIEIAKGCPHLAANGTVEVYEAVPVVM